MTVNKRSGRIIDGHLRVTLAMRNDQPSIPVEYVDLDEHEEAEALATIDPLSAMAGTDRANLDVILQDVQTGNPDVQQMLADLAEEAGMYSVPNIEAPDLVDGDREPYRQMTFTIHDTQFDEIEKAITNAKTDGGDVSPVNENSNGNALAYICERFNDGAS